MDPKFGMPQADWTTTPFRGDGFFGYFVTGLLSFLLRPEAL